MLKHHCGIVRSVVKKYIEPCFRALRRLFEQGDKVINTASAALCINKLYQQLNYYVRTVVEKIVLIECAVPARFHGEYGVFTLCHEPFCFVYNVAVTALEAVMTAPEGRNKIVKTCGGNGVGNDSNSTVLL